MKGKKHTPEQIVTKLRQAQMELGKGATVEQICRKLQINEQTYYRWKREFGGMEVDQHNGPEFIARAVREWLASENVSCDFIEPASPWQNAYSESFNSRFRDELLDREIFTSLTEARVLIEEHRHYYNHEQRHSSLGYKTPAEFATLSEASPKATSKAAAKEKSKTAATGKTKPAATIAA